MKNFILRLKIAFVLKYSVFMTVNMSYRHKQITEPKTWVSLLTFKVMFDIVYKSASVMYLKLVITGQSHLGNVGNIKLVKRDYIYRIQSINQC